MCACCRPQNSAHSPEVRADRVGGEARWLGWPGIVSIFPASWGTQKLWITLSEVRRRSTGWPAGMWISLAVDDRRRRG